MEVFEGILSLINVLLIIAIPLMIFQIFVGVGNIEKRLKSIEDKITNVEESVKKDK